jgi:hypothetical protein
MPFSVDQTGFGGGEISPSLHQDHDIEKHGVGMAEIYNAYVIKQRSIVKRPGLSFVAQGGVEAQRITLRGFQFNTEQVYMLELGENYMRVLKDGGQVLAGSAATITGATQAAPVVITANAHGYSDGDEVFITDVGGMTEINGRNFIVSGATTNTFELHDLFGADVDGSGYAAFTSGGEVDAIYEIATPWSGLEADEVDYVQSADTMYMVHRDYEARKLTRTDHNAWTLTTMTFNPSIDAPTGVAVAKEGASTGVTYSYVVTHLSERGEESLPSAAVTIDSDLSQNGEENTISWTADASAQQSRVYKEENGVHRFIGFTTGTSFVDDNIDPDDNDTPLEETTLFTGAGNYPGAVTFYEQRLALGGTYNDPQVLNLGRSESLENFSTSVLQQANDPIQVRLFGAQVNELRAMVEMNDLFLLTSGSERTLRGNDGFLTPSNGVRSNVSTRGARRIKPILIGDALLFVQDLGEVVYEKVFSGFDGQGQSRYAERELTIIAEHLLRTRQIEAWAYAQSPDSLIVCATSDATGLFFAYHREHDVWAWSQFVTDGEIECVSSIREDGRDVVYAVVKRTINGATKRYVERMSNRYADTVGDAYRVDCGLTYEGAATTTLSGLYHLEGETLVALADGNVVRDLTVTDGAVTLPIASSKVHIGLPYTARLKTLPMTSQTQQGSTKGRKTRIPKVHIGVRDTRGLQIGADLNNLTNLIPRTQQNPSAMTGQYEQSVAGAAWGATPQIILVSEDPLPMEVTSITREIEVAG